MGINLLSIFCGLILWSAVFIKEEKNIFPALGKAGTLLILSHILGQLIWRPFV